MNKKFDDQEREIFLADIKGPWDAPATDDSAAVKGKAGKSEPGPMAEADKTPERKPQNPWEPSIGDSAKTDRQRKPSLEDILRRAGGNGGGFGGLPRRPDGKSWLPILVGGLILLWLSFSSVHRLGPEQQGVVTLFGKYSRTVGPGISFTFPSPIEQMDKLDTQQIRTTSVGSSKATSDNLILTKDQNLIDMAYDIRWSIKDPAQYSFQLDNPEEAVQEVGESAMRASLANFDFNQANGVARSDIEAQVRQRMQQILDEYRSGIAIRGIAIRQSDPPAEVKDAFREVNSAQQQRERYLNDARGYASQVNQLAIGETAEFDKIYEQYRQAPDVTKRRLYYETMEQVLGKMDKTIVESGSVTPYLPLPELKKRVPAKPEEVIVSGKRP
jgi:modulator of FtsH protease HflK